MNRLGVLWILALVAALVVTACAQGANPSGDEGDVPDMGAPSPPNNQAPNNDQMDATPPPPDTTPPEEEVTEDEPEPQCPVCCPGDRRCFSDTVVEVCNGDGTGFDAEPCGEGLFCEGQGACEEPEFSCTPGQTSCIALQTPETCHGDGRSVTTAACQDGLCIGDACRTGAATGETCAADSDCAGGRCLCNAQDGCPEPFQAAWGQGYCTVADCSVSGCQAGEVCVDFGFFGGAFEGSHCIRDCEGCNNLPNISCRQVPVVAEAALEWDGACFPGFPGDMADRCQVDSDCLGGLCWQGELSPSDELGYCTMDQCSLERPCPEGSSCVDFPGQGYFCGRHCGDGNPGSGGCPVNRGLALSCQSMADLSGRRLISICAPRR